MFRKIMSHLPRSAAPPPPYLHALPATPQGVDGRDEMPPLDAPFTVVVPRGKEAPVEEYTL